MAKGFRKSIGEIYEGISFSGIDFSGFDGSLKKPEEHWFVGLCKKLYSFFPSMGKNGVFTEENKSAVFFLNWNLSAEEFAAASKVFAIFLLFLSFLIGGVIIFFEPLTSFVSLLLGGGFNVYFFAFGVPLLVSLFLINYFNSFPSLEAKREQTKALTYVPDILGYMVMSIKLVPNLEKAVEFAAVHGKGKIASDFRSMMWNFQVGVYNSLSEALDELAYKWGNYSEEFKKAMMRIRASVIENTEAKRFALLDQTMSEVLESVRNKMEDYARSLSQPTTMLFYIGVLLPLLLIIILPVGSSFSGAPLANPFVLFFIWLFLLLLLFLLITC